MGNCGGCTKTNAPDRLVGNRVERIRDFEESLPFNDLSIDYFENLVMAVGRFQKVNGEYHPPLANKPLKLHRVVKYFKSVPGFESLQTGQSRFIHQLKSAFLSPKAYEAEERKTEGGDGHSQPSSALNPNHFLPARLQMTIGASGTFFESSVVLIDTEAFMLLGLLYCHEDRPNLKASIFYSMLKSTVMRTSAERQKSKLRNGSSDGPSAGSFQELSCLDEQIECLIFRLCVLS